MRSCSCPCAFVEAFKITKKHRKENDHVNDLINLLPACRLENILYLAFVSQQHADEINKARSEGQEAVDIAVEAIQKLAKLAEDSEGKCECDCKHAGGGALDSVKKVRKRMNVVPLGN